MQETLHCSHIASELALMRITESAKRHGIKAADMEHALRNYVRVFDLDGLQTFIGPAADGTMLEVGYREDDDPRIIHAMPARRKFWP